MNNTERGDVEIATCALEALYSEMHADLGTLDGQIDSLREEGGEAATHTAELAEMHTARTALHSGMASIHEVLGWLLWVDPDAAAAMRPLPQLRGVPIH